MIFDGFFSELHAVLIFANCFPRFLSGCGVFCHSGNQNLGTIFGSSFKIPLKRKSKKSWTSTRPSSRSHGKSEARSSRGEFPTPSFLMWRVDLASGVVPWTRNLKILPGLALARAIFRSVERFMVLSTRMKFSDLVSARIPFNKLMLANVLCTAMGSRKDFRALIFSLIFLCLRRV